jgi:Fic family protein
MIYTITNNITFLYSYLRKEAVLSSMIEGTQSSLSDLLLFELDQQPGGPLDDVRELTGHKRNRVFSYPATIAILNEGTEPFGRG